MNAFNGSKTVSGFDYGTSNCALGIIDDNGPQSSDVTLLPLEGDKAFIPSCLYALERELIAEFVGLNIPAQNEKTEFMAFRQSALAQARRVRMQEGFESDEQTLFFGREGFEQYYEFSEEGYFVKSPKSYLGASGLRAEQVGFFEDIVTAMMLNVKQRAERSLQREITHTVIGKPVNFQGLNAQESNQQALAILTASAKRAGFKEVEFQFEPIAAGLQYEGELTEDKTVLVVDIGGGTTDCAMVRMGPNHRGKSDRKNDFLGHSGERVGGNDLDIQIAGSQLMPLFGLGTELKNGKPVSTKTFWDAVTTNDINAQTNFNSLQTELYLDQLSRDSAAPELIRRFITLRDNRQNHHLVRNAEETKILLSQQALHSIDLSYIEQGLQKNIDQQQLAESVARPVEKMAALMDEAIKQAGCQPDLIFITGGSAHSPVIREAIENKLGDIPVVAGDHFGSVASGLTVWAETVFR